jgi:diadenosine tetraphosphate (Ap4A) HIT family hydrolase
MSGSPFLAIPPSEWAASNDLAFAVRDRFPVSPGHTLVVPKRLIATWFDASPTEQTAIFELVELVRRQLDAERQPDGYNVGFNAGPAAGQTVMHLHVHVIPRYLGDMDDPRGGVRHVIPSRGNYLTAPPPLASGGESDPFARHVLPMLARSQLASIVAAFVQESGLLRIRASLEIALRQGAHVRLVTGDYLNITQASALEMLLDWQSTWDEPDVDGEEAPQGRFEARVVEVDRLPGRTRSFHPKSWHLEGAGFGVAFVGSSNLSLAALETGIEWNLRVDRDRDQGAYTRIREAFNEVWGHARPLDALWVEAYAKRAKERARSLPPGSSTPTVLTSRRSRTRCRKRRWPHWPRREYRAVDARSWCSPQVSGKPGLRPSITGRPGTSSAVLRACCSSLTVGRSCVRPRTFSGSSRVNAALRSGWDGCSRSTATSERILYSPPWQSLPGRHGSSVSPPNASTML